MKFNNGQQPELNSITSVTRGDKTKLRSELAVEIISRQADLTEKIALYVFLAVTCFIVALCCTIKYPDYIEEKGVLKSLYKSVEISPNHSGRISKINVKDGAEVKKGDILAVMENMNDYSEVMQVKKILLKCRTLVGKNRINEVDQYFTKQQDLMVKFNSDITSLSSLEKGISAKSHSDSLRTVSLYNIIDSCLRKIEVWESQYLVIASENGKVSYDTRLLLGKSVTKSKPLGYIIPKNNRYYVEAFLCQEVLGEISVGTHVQLRFDAYPYRKMGFVEGRVTQISGVPSNGKYLITFDLTDGLITSTGHILDYREGLTAKAVILGRDVTLMDRLLSANK